MAVATSTLTARAVWWSAVRPATLAASVAPVLAGTAIAIHQGGIQTLAGLGALVVAICMQLGVNFANDYSDHLRGADSPARVGRAPGRRWIEGKRPGVVLSIATDWRLLIAGAACLAAGWLYTGGPRPYGYLGLGELFVFVFFGLVATCGTVYVESLRITPLAILFGCSMGFLASAILVLNNLRDMESDAAAGKRTLATLIGRQRTLYLLAVLAAAAFAIPIVVFMSHLAPVTVMAVHFAIPIAAVPVRTAFATTSPPRLVAALKRMAVAELAFALLLTVGLVLI